MERLNLNRPITQNNYKTRFIHRQDEHNYDKFYYRVLNGRFFNLFENTVGWLAAAFQGLALRKEICFENTDDEQHTCTCRLLLNEIPI